MSLTPRDYIWNTIQSILESRPVQGGTNESMITDYLCVPAATSSYGRISEYLALLKSLARSSGCLMDCTLRDIFNH